MSSERYVVLGLARSRSPWFADVGRWATTAAIPVDFLRCLSIDELSARLEGGRTVSAVLLDASVPGVDRDLLDQINLAGAVAVAVSPEAPSNWPPGIDATWLPPAFTRQQLLDVLAVHALAVHRADDAVAPLRPLVDSPWRGRLVAVTGDGGAGSSTIAMGLAQGFGADPRNLGLVLLADLALDADQAMLHDARTLVPGLQEAVEAHRNAGTTPQDVRDLVHRIDERGYDLLLGLRNHHDWTALRPRAVAATVASLVVSYRTVVADVDADIEGSERTGSADVEDRNQLARHAITTADLVLVVGTAGLVGAHRHVRTLRRLLEHGVEPARIVPVINRFRGGPASRGTAAATLGHLLDDAGIASPLFVPAKKRLEDHLLDNRSLPASLHAPLTKSVDALCRQLGEPSRLEQEPVAVTPGSLGTILDDVEEDYRR